MFLITHRPGAVAVADQLLMLRDGHVHCQGPRDAVLAHLQAQAQAQAQARPEAPPSAGASAPLPA